MHFLHKILVRIPDAVADRELYENDELIDAVRNYAENETESYYGQAYDWRETDSAGRWSARYPVNVLFADDDLDSFVHELEEAIQNQRQELQFCLSEVKNSVGTDLERIAEGLAERKRAWKGEGGFNNMTAFYLHCVAAHLYGEYRCDSYFFNTNEYTAFVYPEDIEAVKAAPSDWALVLFDYHNWGVMQKGLCSILSYPERGSGGDNRYRGNCSPKLVADLLSFFKPAQVCDYMCGSGTTADAAASLGIDSRCYDLHSGFDLLSCDIPERPEFIF